MDEHGVSPVIGTILILGILAVVASTLVTVVWPQIQDNQDRGDFQIVSSQLSKVGGDVTQMSLGGNVGEIRQRTVATSQGELSLQRGHLWAISIGVLGEDYNDVSSETRVKGEHPAFRVTDHNGPEGNWIEVKYEDENYDGVNHHLNWTAHRFTGSDWDECAPCSQNGLYQHEDAFTVDLQKSDKTLRDGPWRIQIREDDSEGDLIGEVYVYELNRIVYDSPGALMSRGVWIENGAVFTQEDNTHYNVGAGLYRTATTGGGSSGLNLRASQLDADTFPSTSGRSKTSFQLSLTVQQHLAQNLGVIHTRLEPLDGPLTDHWSAHLAGGEFDPGSSGVKFEWPTEDPDQIKTYPLSVIYNDIRIRMVSH